MTALITRRAKERFMAGDVFGVHSVGDGMGAEEPRGLTRKQVNLLLSAIASAPTVEIENRARMLGAINAHRHGFDFADAIHLLSAHACDGLWSFDAALRKQSAQTAGFVKVLEP